MPDLKQSEAIVYLPNSDRDMIVANVIPKVQYVEDKTKAMDKNGQPALRKVT